MSKLPAAYAWLEEIESKPRMISEALELFGVHEAKNKKSGNKIIQVDNPVILAWAHEIGGDVAASYNHDTIPWCGLFMAVVANRADKPVPVNPLWALNWRKFGQSAGTPMLGDVLVFRRPSGGHVGLYVGEDSPEGAGAKAFHVLGGNQSDQVSITRIEKSRLVAARRPAWKVQQPVSVRRYILAATGKLSEDEA